MLSLCEIENQVNNLGFYLRTNQISQSEIVLAEIFMSQKTFYANFDTEENALRSLKAIEFLATCDPKNKIDSRHRAGQIALGELEVFENLSNHSNQEIADIAFSLVYIFSEEFPEEDTCNFVLSNIDRAVNLANQEESKILDVDSLAKSIVNSVNICDIEYKKQTMAQIINYQEHASTAKLASSVLHSILTSPNIKNGIEESFLQDPIKLAYFLEVGNLMGRLAYSQRRFAELTQTAEAQNDQSVLQESFI